MGVSDQWSKAVRDADGLILDRVARTLSKSEDKIVVAEEIKSLMPLVDQKILPKTHNRLVSIISRGEKEKKKRQ